MMIDENLETFSLVWLDADNNMEKNNGHREQQLRNISYHLRKFDNEHEFQTYIERTSKDDRLVLIINGELTRSLVPRIHRLYQVSSIYIYAINKNVNDQWIKESPKVTLMSFNLLTTELQW